MLHELCFLQFLVVVELVLGLVTGNVGNCSVRTTKACCTWFQ